MRFASTLILSSLLLGGCGGTEDAPSPTTTGPGAELTLASCTTNVAADVPEFFRTYFKCATITMNGANVSIRTSGLPPHRSYYYGEGHPNFEAFDFSRGALYRPNPNRIATQDIRIEVPLGPRPKGLSVTAALVDHRAGTSTLEYSLGPVGVALNGVALFSGLAGPGDRIEDEQFTFDRYNAHPQMNGQYHYHTTTAGPLEVLTAARLATTSVPGQAELEVYGILCDGTLALGCTELDGTRASSADFDAQNGHVHDLRDKAGVLHFAGRYHTHVCAAPSTHPFTPEIQYYDTCARPR